MVRAPPGPRPNGSLPHATSRSQPRRDGNGESGVGSRESGVGSRESGAGGREWGIGRRDSRIGSRASRVSSCRLPTSYSPLPTRSLVPFLRAGAGMAIHPPDHLMAHTLPSAPRFVGREAELAAQRGFWSGRCAGVLALVGLGGAGKTALAAQFLGELTAGNRVVPRPEGLLVWSFLPRTRCWPLLAGGVPLLRQNKRPYSRRQGCRASRASE
jgi:hypothetical protein